MENQDFRRIQKKNQYFVEIGKLYLTCGRSCGIIWMINRQVLKVLYIINKTVIIFWSRDHIENLPAGKRSCYVVKWFVRSLI